MVRQGSAWRIRVALVVSFVLLIVMAALAPSAKAVSRGCTDWDFHTEDYLIAVGQFDQSFEAGETISVDFETAPPQEPPIPPATRGELLVRRSASSPIETVDSSPAPGTLSYTVSATRAYSFVGIKFDSSAHVTNFVCAPVGAIVPFKVSRFFQPVNNEPTVNAAIAGRVIPFRFRVTDSGGRPVTDLADVRPTLELYRCQPGIRQDAIEHYAKTWGLVNRGDGFYTFRYQTRATWGGRCATIGVDVGFGGARSAAFKLRD